MSSLLATCIIPLDDVCTDMDLVEEYTISETFSIKTRKLPELGALKSKLVQKNLADILESSDVRTNVYEGGFKIWETSLDLIEYLCHLPHDSSAWSRQCVLELGCGHGLPSIFALKSGASLIACQDLNRDVLVHTLLPNLMLNKLNSNPNAIHCVAGDWRCPNMVEGLLHPFRSRSLDQKYTLLLTAETIYSEKTFEALSNVICGTMAPNGLCLVAGKRYYFGIGGGTVPFVEFIKQSEKFQLDARVVRVVDDGMSNIREIVEISWKNGDVSPFRNQNVEIFEHAGTQEGDEDEEYNSFDEDEDEDDCGDVGDLVFGQPSTEYQVQTFGVSIREDDDGDQLMDVD